MAIEITVIHLLALFALLLSLIVPFWKIFPRAGWPPHLALLMAITPVNMVLIWILAFKRWPGDA